MFLLSLSLLPLNLQVVSEADTHRKQELSAMRERHRQRFQAATAKLRDQYKQVCKANKKLESQLLRSSVS